MTAKQVTDFTLCRLICSHISFLLCCLVNRNEFTVPALCTFSYNGAAALSVPAAPSSVLPYREAMAAFGGTAPDYHIELLDKSTIYWDLHSLLLGIQMMFSFMLVDGDHPLHLCKHCQKVFLGSRPMPTFVAHGARTSIMSTRAVLKRAGMMKLNEEE